MTILNIQTAPPAGQAAVTSSTMSTQSTLPSLIYILTDDTYATVTATGYLTASKSQGNTYSNNQMALVYTTDEGPVWAKVVITYSGATIENTVVSLVQISSPGDVVLPTVANHLMVSTDTGGTLANLTGTAIQSGSLQAGLSGTAGTLISFPSTASKGSLIVAGVANTGNTNVTISNALHGQASVYSIPDSGSATANFLVSASAAGQSMSGGLTLSSGNLGVTLGNITASAGGISAPLGNLSAGGTVTAGTGISTTTGDIVATNGSVTAGTGSVTAETTVNAGTGVISGRVGGGTAGSLILYSATIANGSLRMLAVGNVGDFATTISDVAGLGQAQLLTIPDGGQATGEFIISDSAGTQHITSGGFQVDAGTISGGLASGGTPGRIDLYAPTTANGILSLLAVNAGADFDTTISNSASVGQDQVITIPDVGAATGVFATSPSLSAAIAPKTFVRTITAGFAALAAAGTVTVQASTSGTCQFTIVDVKVMYAAAGLSGGGGDRLLSLTDGTIAFNDTGITAALLGSPVYTVFGGTGNPLPGAVSTISTAGAAIVLQYAGGTTDYTAGDITVQVTLAQVTL